MEVEANDTLLFLEVWVMKRGPKLAMKVYQKPTHTDHYLPKLCKMGGGSFKV
jgi:hypothetical protein